MDIKETKELAIFVCRLGNAVDASLADGKIGLTDATNLLGPFMAAGPAFAGIDKLPSELSDMDPLEAQELKACIAAELDLRNDGTEVVIEQVAELTLQLAAAILAMKKAKAA